MGRGVAIEQRFRLLAASRSHAGPSRSRTSPSHSGRTGAAEARVARGDRAGGCGRCRVHPLGGGELIGRRDSSDRPHRGSDDLRTETSARGATRRRTGTRTGTPRRRPRLGRTVGLLVFVTGQPRLASSADGSNEDQEEVGGHGGTAPTGRHRHCLVRGDPHPRADPAGPDGPVPDRRSRSQRGATRRSVRERPRTHTSADHAAEQYDHAGSSRREEHRRHRPSDPVADPRPDHRTRLHALHRATPPHPHR